MTEHAALNLEPEPAECADQRSAEDLRKMKMIKVMKIKMGCLIPAVLLALLLAASECLQISVQLDKDSTVTLSTLLSQDQCSICVINDQTGPDCSTSQIISPSETINSTLLLNCSQPYTSVSVLIRSRIVCSKSSCSPGVGGVLDPFLSGFNRTLMWDLRAPVDAALVVEFPGGGLQKVGDGGRCEDWYQYSVDTSASGDGTQLQRFCRNGSVDHLELRNQATVAITVSPQEQLNPPLFTVTPTTLQKKGRTMTVVPDPNTSITIKKSPQGPDCTVCVGEGTSRTCGSTQTLSDAQTTVEFSCSRPQDAFTVEIIRDLDCTKSCSYDSIHSDASFFPDFSKTFIWDLKVSSVKSFQLDFPEPGMRQIPSGDLCPDKHTYSVVMYQRGTVGVGTFCRNGTVTRMQIPYKGRVTLAVPKDTPLIQSDFIYSETTGSVWPVVVATLPRGQSSTEFYSASGIPSDYGMSWSFVVPPLHNFSVEFVDPQKPECQSKEVKVTYLQDRKPPLDKTLTDAQPSNYQGNFNLSLTNCDLKKNSASSLLLKYRVSVFRSGVPYRCTVDLSADAGLSVEVGSRTPGSFCELSLNSVVQEKITVPSGSRAELSFLDCPSTDLLLTATKTLECKSLSSCLRSGNLLTVPALDPCLPVPLQQVRWDVQVPHQGSVELSSPQGTLLQSVLGQDCTGSVSLLVSQSDGSGLGRFCPLGGQGAIQKVQVRSSISITTTTDPTTRDLSKYLREPLLNVSFIPEITDEVIYTTSPLVSSPIVLATPNWPAGMKPDSTVSWLISVPEEHSAELLFINISQPSCRQSHATVTVQELDSTRKWSFREDEKMEKYDAQSSFYLNMSNCEPEQGNFAFLTKISLQKKSRKLLSIILAVVGALLVVMMIILAVVCVVVRKKKRQVNRSSIYIPKGAVSLPGDATFSTSFPKSRVDNESHVYDSIDDTMIYGHLLAADGQTDRGPGHYNGHQERSAAPRPGSGSFRSGDTPS
uniref:CUB domain containing protein 1a n=1 Tax=Astyanax mexicanus TaxID=7994 RepID=A0A3B1IN57_ASTMX